MNDTNINPLTGLPIEDSSLKELSTLVEELARTEDEISRRNNELKDLKDKQIRLSQTLIPDKLDDLGLSTITTSTGRKVIIRKFYTGKALSQDSFAWLDKQGYGDIIKTTVEKRFTRDEREEALKLAERLGFDMKESIHHQTMGAFIRELSEEGKQLPPELFSVYEGRRTKLS